MATYPPAPATVAGDNLTASRFLQNPNFVARRVQQLGDLRYVGSMLLKGRQASVGGAVGYEQVEGIFADAGPEVVAPGSEYTLTTIKDGPAGVARVVKYGKDTIVTDEAIKRRSMDPVEKGLRKLVNSAAQAIDQSVISVIASAVTAGGNAAAKWTTNPATILQDIMLAQAAITGLNQGYNPDMLVVDDTIWAYLASNSTIANAMARETANSPIYTGRFQLLAGLEVVHVPAANLPGGTNANAWVLDSQQLGFIATEDLGGGYTAAGDLVETKVMRQDENDRYRVRARSNFAPVVTDPGAAYKIGQVA